MYFDDFEENEHSNRISFRFTEQNEDGSTREIETVLRNKESYADITQQFVYFLQSIGYTYIAGIAVLDNDGDELHVTDI